MCATCRLTRVRIWFTDLTMRLGRRRYAAEQLAEYAAARARVLRELANCPDRKARA